MSIVTRNNNLSVLDNRFRSIALNCKSNIPLIADKFTETKTTDRAYEQFDYWAGVGEAAIVAEGALFPSKDIKKGDSKTINVSKWGFQTNVTKELIDDNQFEPIMGILAKAMRNSMRQTEERQGVNLLNNGFVTTYDTTPDGVALFSASHVLKQTGALQSNTATAAALDIDTLWAGINTMKTTVGDSGLYDNVYLPNFLIVPQQLERRAHELLKSTYVPQSMENQDNVMPTLYKINILTTPLLTSTTAWFMTASPADVVYYGLVKLQREALSIKALFDTKGADVGKDVDRDVFSWRAKQRYAFGLVHWNGVFGNSGA